MWKKGYDKIFNLCIFLKDIPFKPESSGSQPGAFGPLGDIEQSLETLLAVRTGAGSGRYCHLEQRPGMLKLLQCTQDIPAMTRNNHPTKKTNSAEVKKP